MSDVVVTPSQILVKTYGCKVNTYDSGLLEKRLSGFYSSGIVSEDASTITSRRPIFVLNTCAVTRDATQEAVREVKRIRAKNADGVIVVTGCAAQVDTESFTDMTEADLIIANSHKAHIESIIADFLAGRSDTKVFKSNIFKKDDFEPGGGNESQHSRSFLKIQDGCNSFCTFCVIPFARGKSRSLPIDELVARVNEIESQGFREVVLTGVHIGDYEFGLENLVESLLERTTMPRFRLGSLEPIELSDRLLSLFGNDRLCRHFHMSIQSASTSILHGMKRKYGSEEVEFALRAIADRVPGSFVGMDVIAGFPGESEEDFQDTFLRLSDLPWSRIHVFPYSERPGTYALRLDGKVEGGSLHRRASRLRELSFDRQMRESAAQVGMIKQVLWLKGVPQLGRADSVATGSIAVQKGLARDYWPVEVRVPADFIPDFAVESSVRIVGREMRKGRQDAVLLGEMF